MTPRGVLAAVLTGAVVAACAGSPSPDTKDPAFSLPVGPTTWDASAPAWLHDGTLHVGAATVRLGGGVDQFVLGATGAYWMRGGTLMFTSAEGETQRVEDVGWGNLAVSADHTVLATVDQSRGPTDQYGTHVMQVAAFDTRTGEQLYRTPDEKPDRGDDLADLYGEVMPLLHGVSDEHLFYDGATIDLDDGSSRRARTGADGVEVYPDRAETLFPDGFHVGIRGEGRTRELTDSTLAAVGRLSPDRSTIFDSTAWPSDAVVYDAETGRRRAIGSPWRHFTLAGWSDERTFFGVAEDVDEQEEGVVHARQVVSCVLPSLACEPVSPVVPEGRDGALPALMVEGAPVP
ncbi:hypothetical protein [Aeromicrobium sp. 179-A 4D2 NHS]|uniref:hypothetical protein n=1 Tax=Aeromicrobium sp. 179-A 4D2 NHS TaxID=3142375 RepID=UPI0039A0FC3C